MDKVLETVVNNLEVTNNLDIEPEVRCRVMMTSTLESFTVGHTIVLSRGLIDVLPDEASLATMIAHELSHVVLGHRIDSNLRVLRSAADRRQGYVPPLRICAHAGEEKAANAKAMQAAEQFAVQESARQRGAFPDGAGDARRRKFRT